MISFRVSDEEFEKLRSFCHSQGGHNVSELARTAVQKLVDGSASAQPLESRIQAIEREIRRLDAILTHHEQNGNSRTPEPRNREVNPSPSLRSGLQEDGLIEEL